jgi:hypothetical protein
MVGTFQYAAGLRPSGVECRLPFMAAALNRFPRLAFPCQNAVYSFISIVFRHNSRILKNRNTRKITSHYT